MTELQCTRAFIKGDPNGCKLFVRMYAHDGKEVSAMVQLQAAGERRIRNLGFVTLADMVFHVKRNREKHLHQQSKSYGFNDTILREQSLFRIEYVHVTEDDTTHYIVPASTIHEFGSYLHFKEQGFERQRFLRIDTLKLFKQDNYADKWNITVAASEDAQGERTKETSN